jgi:calcium-dependent protein kinase
VDADASGTIDYSEFISLCCNRTKLLTRDKLTRAFKELDLDGNGQIDKGELRKAFEAGCGVKRSDSFWEGLVTCIDQGGDHLISLEEFIDHMDRLNRKTIVIFNN